MSKWGYLRNRIEGFPLAGMFNTSYETSTGTHHAGIEISDILALLDIAEKAEEETPKHIMCGPLEDDGACLHTYTTQRNKEIPICNSCGRTVKERYSPPKSKGVVGEIYEQLESMQHAFYPVNHIIDMAFVEAVEYLERVDVSACKSVLSILRGEKTRSIPK